MQTQTLTQEIERFANKAKETNRFFTKIDRGEFTPENLATFLYTAYYLVLHTPIHLHRAKDRAQELGDRELRAFFDEKIKEEFAHQIWAVQDLRAVMKRYDISDLPEPVPAVKNLTAYIEKQIEADPALYLPYILLAEYFTVLMGPAWTSALEERCGIERSLVSVIGNHIELDRHHVEDDLEELNALLNEHADRPYDSVLRHSIKLFDSIYHQVAA